MSQSIPIFNLSNSRGFFKYIPLNDIHIGAKTFDKTAFEKTIKYITDNNKNKVPTYWSIDGDCIDNITANCVADPYDQSILPADQADLLISYLKPIKHYGLFAISGNHTWRTRKRAYYDIMQSICRELGLKYLGTGGYIRFDIGKQQYIGATHHGDSGSQNSELELKRLERIYSLAEFLILGHNHALYWEYIMSLGILNNKEVQILKYYGRSGAYNGFAEYARGKCYAMKPSGSLCIKFHQDQHLIEGHRMLYINGERLESVAHTGRTGKNKQFVNRSK